MSDCPICGSDSWTRRSKECDDCGHYDESHHHGSIARRREEAHREIDRQQDRY